MKDIQLIYRYLDKELLEGKIDFSIRARKEEDGTITFYIHPTGKDGTTEDYKLFKC